MRIYILLLTILQTVVCTCPKGLELVRDGQCRGFYTTISGAYKDSVTKSISKCSEIKAQPVIIHNSEEQNYWRALRKNNFLPIGLTCNTYTKQWQWADGSQLTYKPPTYNEDLDKSCKTGCSWNLWDTGYWNNGCDTKSHTYDIYCTLQLPKIPNSGDGCEDFEDDSEDGACYQVNATVQNWQDAQKTCKNAGADLASIHSLKENSFIRRLAISRGAVSGLFLGGVSSGKGNSFGWIDGSDWDYDNFYSGFPVAGLGDCVVMDTAGSTSGEWVNTDCSSTMSVACVRKPKEHECSNGPWQEGEMITSPGYPYDSSIPCDYMLSVAEGKRVELEVNFLEANSCCDHLVLYDNYVGRDIIANLTGEINEKKYTTKSSNFMRVSWNPQGGVNVRGMMISFRAV